MDEELVYRAKSKMLKINRLGNIMIIIIIGLQSAMIFNALLFAPDVTTALPLILGTALLSVIFMSLIAMTQQSAVFNLAISLLKYIETNNPDVNVPDLYFKKEGKL